MCCLHSTHIPSDLQGHFQMAFPSIFHELSRSVEGPIRVIGVSVQQQEETLQEAPHHLFPTSFPPKVYCMHQSRFLPTKACYTCPTYLNASLVSTCSALWSSSFAFRKKTIGKLSTELWPAGEDPLSQCCLPGALPGKSKSRRPGSDSFAFKIHQ